MVSKTYPRASRGTGKSLKQVGTHFLLFTTLVNRHSQLFFTIIYRKVTGKIQILSLNVMFVNKARYKQTKYIEWIDAAFLYLLYITLCFTLGSDFDKILNFHKEEYKSVIKEIIIILIYIIYQRLKRYFFI